MAGHSKWANIRYRKGVQDAKRGKIFTKLIREISVAARMGGADEDANSRLRDAITKALKANMKRDTIDNAIKRGVGGQDGANMIEMRYEGYAPGGVAILVDCLSDNKNRTVADVRHFFNKHGGRLAADGSVSWMFSHKGEIIVPLEGNTEDSILENLLDYDVEEVFEDEDGFHILCVVTQLDAVRHGVEKAGFKVVSAEMTWKPNDRVETLSSEESESVTSFIDGLEDIDDVQAVYDNLG